MCARAIVVERNTDREIDGERPKGKDVLVLLHPCDPRIECTTSKHSPKLSPAEIKAVHDFVRNGGGLFVVTEYESQKYGNNLNDVISEFGITIDAFSTVTDRAASINEEKTHVLADIMPGKDSLLIGVTKALFYHAGSCKVKSGAILVCRATQEAGSGLGKLSFCG